MPSVAYGSKSIEYAIDIADHLKSHYISVEKARGVVLKGKEVDPQQADKLVLKRARWILEKLELVRSIKATDIVTGSRIPYLGRKYYAEVFINPAISSSSVVYNASKFKITLPDGEDMQGHIKEALSRFYKEKAVEKITPRIRKWVKLTGLTYSELKFRSMDKRWGSCTEENNIIINIEAIKLPYTLIDYLLVHELCHTKEKSHSKAFWAELSKHLPKWKELDREMYGVRI